MRINPFIILKLTTTAYFESAALPSKPFEVISIVLTVPPRTYTFFASPEAFIR